MAVSRACSVGLKATETMHAWPGESDAPEHWSALIEKSLAFTPVLATPPNVIVLPPGSVKVADCAIAIVFKAVEPKLSSVGEAESEGGAVICVIAVEKFGVGLRVPQWPTNYCHRDSARSRYSRPSDRRHRDLGQADR